MYKKLLLKLTPSLSPKAHTWKKILFLFLFLSLITSPPAFAQLGTVTAPAGVPVIAANTDPTDFVGTLIRNLITILITTAFIIDLVWTIFAGIRFITAGGDPKTVSTAWSQIYWGLVGMVVVLGSFAIIKMVETFFGVNIIQNFQIPKG